MKAIANAPIATEVREELFKLVRLGQLSDERYHELINQIAQNERDLAGVVKLGCKLLSQQPKVATRRMPKHTASLEHLQALCWLKGIVCERRGKMIEMTTPDGGTTAICLNLREAYADFRNDSAFSALPDRADRRLV